MIKYNFYYNLQNYRRRVFKILFHILELIFYVCFLSSLLNSSQEFCAVNFSLLSLSLFSLSSLSLSLSLSPAEHESRVRSSNMSSSIPLFTYAHMHSVMSAHSTNFISPTIVCQHVMAVRRHAVYVDTDILAQRCQLP